MAVQALDVHQLQIVSSSTSPALQQVAPPSAAQSDECSTAAHGSSASKQPLHAMTVRGAGHRRVGRERVRHHRRRKCRQAAAAHHSVAQQPNSNSNSNSNTDKGGGSGEVGPDWKRNLQRARGSTLSEREQVAHELLLTEESYGAVLQRLVQCMDAPH